MRDKNKSIYQFIIELERKKDREHAFREKLCREDLLGSTEQLSTSQPDSFAIPKGLSPKETIPLSERNQPIDEKHESDLRVTEHVEIGNPGTELFKAGVFGYRLETELGISSALAAFSFISIIVLLQIEALINQNLHSNALQILKGAAPYWIALNTALGIFWVMTIARNIFRTYALKHKQEVI